MMVKIKFTDTENLNPYSDEYNKKIQTHKEELENLLKEQQETRLSGIKKEYQIKIDDGQQKLDDAKKELEDARNKLADASTKIENAKIEISENETKLNDARNQINSSEIEIKNKENQLNAKQKEYEDSLNEYNNKEKELKLAETQINSSQVEINNKMSQLESGKEQYEKGIASLNTGIKECEDALQNTNLPESQKTIINQKLSGYKTQLQQTQAMYNEFMNNTYKPSINELSEAQKTLDMKKSDFNTRKQQLEEANKKLQSAKNQLNSGNALLNSAKSKLQLAKKEYNTNKIKLENAKTELQEEEKEYNEKLKEFQEKEPDAVSKIDENEKNLSDSRKKLEKLSLPTYSVDNRRELPGGEGYRIYETVSNIVDSLAKVFPVFLYLVASLVTLTTIARFVGEERINNGTLKSLGYSDKDVMKKFTVYGFIAGTIGTVIGIALGHTIIPMIVYNAYHSGFTLPKIELHFYLRSTIIAIILSLISSVVPARIIASKKYIGKTKDISSNTVAVANPCRVIKEI